MPNAFVHVELNTTDLDTAKSFYGKLFEWTLEDMPIGGGTYTLIKVGKGTGGGMMTHPMPGAQSNWLAYVEVKDIHASTESAKSLGAQIVRDVTEVQGMGWLSIIIDPLELRWVFGKPKCRHGPKSVPAASHCGRSAVIPASR